ncbi:hypothetical protein GEMRC1_001346 [Eukaryota sp. GEM-RC1]
MLLFHLSFANVCEENFSESLNYINGGQCFYDYTVDIFIILTLARCSLLIECDNNRPLVAMSETLVSSFGLVYLSHFLLLLTSFSLPPAETLAIILDEPSLCNQTISFGGESIDVNKSVLAAHSIYFRSLWFLEFGDKLENSIDFSHLPVDSDNFLAYLKSFFGKSFTLNESNAYNFFYLVHYFQVDKLIHHVENHLNTHLVTWAWLKPFIKEANERNDLRALEFFGPFSSKIDDLVIDDVMTITTEGSKILSKFCLSTHQLS